MAEWDEPPGGLIDLLHAHLPDVPEVVAHRPFTGAVRVAEGLTTLPGYVWECLQGFKCNKGVPVGGSPLVRAEGAAVSGAEEVNFTAKQI